ncbi:MAG: Signal transduction response regulator, receiver domain [Magnetococcales bacterium]|nr:Signal transduction response regulator, receiver domain [Magnetococcales bacterium]
MTRILVIEDERQVRDVLKQILEKAGYAVDTSEDGRKGLEHFRKNPADMVITDILMPDKDGLETIEELVGLNPGLPIIAISGGGPGEKAQFALDVAKMCGAVRVLAKPFSRKEILETVGDLFREIQ